MIKNLIINFNNKKVIDNRIYTFINPYSYFLLRKTKLIRNLDGIYVDGISLVAIFNFFGIKTKRKSFDMTSLAPVVFKECISDNKNIYFIGSNKEEIYNFVQIIKKEYPKLYIIGYQNGYFNGDVDYKNELEKIYSKRPDVVVCGMGAKHQEQFLIDLRKIGWSGTGFTCGGFIHQTAKGINYYPSFFNRHNLRWFYRIYDEPKLIYRYSIIYPFAIFIIIYELVIAKVKDFRNNSFFY